MCRQNALFLLMLMRFWLPALGQDTLPLSGSLIYSDLPQFTYGQGLGITSPDSLFQLNIRFRIQNRFSFDRDKQEVSEVEARVRRARLRFDGFLYSPNIRYALQLSFAHVDIGDFIGTIPNILRDAMIYYTPHPAWTFAFGQTKLPGNRERVVWSDDLQLADRSTVNSIFNIDRDFGSQVFHHKPLLNSAEHVIKAAISAGEGRNWKTSEENFLPYTLRGELLPFGVFTNKGDFFQGDIQREHLPKFSLGLVYNYNQKALRSAGQCGDLLFASCDIQNVMADILFKYQGMSLAGEFIRRRASDPVTINDIYSDYPVFVFNGNGVAVQASYLFPNLFEGVIRYSGVFADKEIHAYVPISSNGYTVGINKYLRGHRLKVQLDVTWFDDFLQQIEVVESDYWQVRFQEELGI